MKKEGDIIELNLKECYLIGFISWICISWIFKQSLGASIGYGLILGFPSAPFVFYYNRKGNKEKEKLKAKKKLKSYSKELKQLEKIKKASGKVGDPDPCRFSNKCDDYIPDKRG